MNTLLLAAILMFPSVQGKNLEGKEYSLPQDLEGKMNIVIVAFQRNQQMLVDTWLSTVRQIKDQTPGLFYYEMPTMSRGYTIMRGIIDGGMRRGIKDLSARESTITVYTNTGKFRKALNIPSDETIHVFLLDSTGAVRWRSEGAMSPMQAELLKGAVKELSGS